MALPYGLSAVPLTYSPAGEGRDPSSPSCSRTRPTGPTSCNADLQQEPARQLANIQKMPILVVTSEASYHAPYDHCTVKYLQQAGVKPTFIKLADLGIKGNSHVMMNEKNNKEIAAVIAQWLGQDASRRRSDASVVRPTLRGGGKQVHFWHVGQKNVDRPFCTMRLTVPPQPGVGHGLPSRS